MTWFILFLSLLLTIILHEAGHLLLSILCKVKVDAFCVGFFKPFIHKKWKGIDWRITPWLLGGYCAIAGETTNKKNGLLVQPYWKKCLIILGGVFVNLMLAFICYWINYKSIIIGLKLDWYALQSCFTSDLTNVTKYYLLYTPNMILWQFSMINIFCFATNIFCFPSLDGGYLWLYLMEPVWKKNYIKYLQIVTKIGFATIMVLQAVLIIWMFLK